MNIKFHKVLITGTAGFIGFHLASRLLDSGYHVTGIDNLNQYYDVRLKENRLAILTPHENFEFHKIDLSDKKGLEKIFGNTFLMLS